MSKIESLLALVRRANFEEIEFARDQVTFSDLGVLAAAYSSLETWDQKAALINLVQDHFDPRFRPLMLDFLRAPDPHRDDTIQLTKAIAICHLDENFDDFMKYYNDRALLDARVQQLTKSTHPAREKLFPQAIRIPIIRNPAWRVVGITAVIVGLGLIMLALINMQTFQKYRKEGVIVEARITDKRIEDGNTCIGVSFFDKDLFDGGELYLTEVCDFVSSEIWHVVRTGGHELVVFLPEDPQNNTILAASLENNPLTSLSIGLVFLGLGSLALGGQRRMAKRSKQD